MTDNDKIAKYFDNDEVLDDISKLAQSIHDDYMSDAETVAYAIDENSEGVQMLTIGASVDDNGDVAWSWQSGDNSYTGGAYPYEHWGVCYFDPETNGDNYAKQVVTDLIQGLPW